MNSLGSECSSGCESGWTMYLDNSSISLNPCQNGQFGDEDGVFGKGYEQKVAKEEYEEEDLSMVSDASSGPPHFHEHEDYCNENGFFSASSVAKSLKKSSKRQKIKQQHHQQQQSSSLMDDTASSPIFNFPKNNFTPTNKQISIDNLLGFSQDYTATQLKKRSAFQKHFSFLKSSLPGKQSSAEPVVCRKESGNGLW